MKRYLLLISCILYLVILLCFPSYAFTGALKGLLLWFQSVIPSLFPFAVIASLLLSTNLLSFFGDYIGHILGRVFHVSNYGSFVILAGFICGYPMGAKLIADLYKKGHIAKAEAEYLLSFCNNTSPMFLISFVLLQMLEQKSFVIPSLLIHISVPLMCSFLFRHFHKTGLCKQKSLRHHVHFQFSYVDAAISSGVETIVKVGAYMMLFSILLTCVSHIDTASPLFQLVLFPSIEVSGGIRYIAEHTNSAYQAYVPMMALTSFGGLCSIAQVKSMLEHTDLSIRLYIIEKLITALVTSFVAYCYITCLIP